MRHTSGWYTIGLSKFPMKTVEVLSQSLLNPVLVEFDLPRSLYFLADEAIV